jgi:hypothetical protein
MFDDHTFGALMDLVDTFLADAFTPVSASG